MFITFSKLWFSIIIICLGQFLYARGLLSLGNVFVCEFVFAFNLFISIPLVLFLCHRTCKLSTPLGVNYCHRCCVSKWHSRLVNKYFFRDKLFLWIASSRSLNHQLVLLSLLNILISEFRFLFCFPSPLCSFHSWEFHCFIIFVCCCLIFSSMSFLNAYPYFSDNDWMLRRWGMCFQQELFALHSRCQHANLVDILHNSPRLSYP